MIIELFFKHASTKFETPILLTLLADSELDSASSTLVYAAQLITQLISFILK